MAGTTSIKPFWSDGAPAVTMGRPPGAVAKGISPIGATPLGPAVTPLPSMVTWPVRSGSATGQVMVMVGVAQLLQTTVVWTKLLGIGGGVYVAGLPVQISTMMYVAVHALVGQAANPTTVRVAVKVSVTVDVTGNGVQVRKSDVMVAREVETLAGHVSNRRVSGQHPA